MVTPVKDVTEANGLILSDRRDDGEISPARAPEAGEAGRTDLPRFKNSAPADPFIDDDPQKL
jgi:hypothetical protein